jgi:hypothetical protein
MPALHGHDLVGEPERRDRIVVPGCARGGQQVDAGANPRRCVSGGLHGVLTGFAQIGRNGSDVLLVEPVVVAVG